MTELDSAREKGKRSSFLLILCTDNTEIKGGGGEVLLPRNY